MINAVGLLSHFRNGGDNVSRLQLHRRQISFPRQSIWRSLQIHTAHWENEIGQLWHFFCVAMIHSSQWYTKFPFVEADCARGSSIKIHHADDLVLLTDFVSIEGDCCDAEQY